MKIRTYLETLLFVTSVAVLLAALGGSVAADDNPARKPTGKRSFRMGFTGFVYDTTLEAVSASRKFVRENGDILAHHIEGVPWAEALNGQPFPKAVLEEWTGKKLATPPKGKVYLAISPGRGDLKVQNKAGPLPKELTGKAYDDPLVMKAYLNYYPFFVPDKDRLAALDWMTAEFDTFKKPYAIVETNDTAERLPLPKAKVVLEGTPEKQAAYYRKLLAMAQKRDFVFVISFVHQDYDALWDKIKDHSPELFIAWRDCGLLDEQGKARPAYHVWKDFFDLPLQN